MQELRRFIDSAFVEFTWTWLSPIQERNLRKKCIKEILASAENAGIKLSGTCLSAKHNCPEGTDNSAASKLMTLKRQGARYSIAFYVDDGRKLIPAEFSTDGRRIGETRNTQYSSQWPEYYKKRTNIEKLIKPEFAQDYLDCQKKYLAELAGWEKKHKEWEEIPMSTWEEQAPGYCTICDGTGRHGTGQSGIGDVYCECGGGEYNGLSPLELRSSSEPVKPTPDTNSVDVKLGKRVTEELSKLGIVQPREAFYVYARFVRNLSS